MDNKKHASLEDQPIKRAKSKVYGEIMDYARGSLAQKLKVKHGQPAHVTDGREEDRVLAEQQAGGVQDHLDAKMGGVHGGPQFDTGQAALATHVGLGEKQEPLKPEHLKQAMEAGAHGPPHVMPEHKGLKALGDLTDDEVKKLLGGKC